MFVGRLLGDHQRIGDLAIGQPAGDQGRDFPFTLGQRRGEQRAGVERRDRRRRALLGRLERQINRRRQRQRPAVRPGLRERLAAEPQAQRGHARDRVRVDRPAAVAPRLLRAALQRHQTGAPPGSARRAPWRPVARLSRDRLLPQASSSPANDSRLSHEHRLRRAVVALGARHIAQVAERDGDAPRAADLTKQRQALLRPPRAQPPERRWSSNAMARLFSVLAHQRASSRARNRARLWLQRSTASAASPRLRMMSARCSSETARPCASPICWRSVRLASCSAVARS